MPSATAARSPQGLDLSVGVEFLRIGHTSSLQRGGVLVRLPDDLGKLGVRQKTQPTKRQNRSSLHVQISIVIVIAITIIIIMIVIAVDID